MTAHTCARSSCTAPDLPSCGVKRERSPFGAWLDALEQRAPINVVITAAANKLSRIAWAVLSSGQDYRPAVSAMAA
jgi:transposase